ncbi:cryptochrome/photolyase family protein [Terriglobus aquaticus]|uniref:Cryptochrome/photolyase family protein n=1 Tax=Terriglobus aquaticus TaxID=940139 RepID=A0ABW9KJ85_9BACT|nr:cryptochrome/photolyase family protein [Terriglobus aquaticus]
MPFLEQMRAAEPDAAERKRRTWVFVPYDRINDRIGPLAKLAPAEAGLILIESHAKGRNRPYHKKKVLVVLSNMRHFALEQQARGVAVIYRNGPPSYGEQLLELQRELGLPSIHLAEPAERELRKDLETWQAKGLDLTIGPDDAWLSTAEDWSAVFGDEPASAPQVGGRGQRQFLMERFYRYMRKKTGILMDSPTKFVGGQLSFDADNRQAYRGEVPVPTRPSYPPDAITLELIEWLSHNGVPSIGTFDGFDLPVTASDCRAYWQFALKELLPNFGPYEDAMSSREPMLFHSAISALMNVSRILPQDVIRDVADAYDRLQLPLARAEGFIRQILGWREFMRHIHRVTDGFRTVEQRPDPPSNRSANEYSALLVKERNDAAPDRPATPSALDAHRPLPPAYWGVPSGMFCLDTATSQVMFQGWSHHILRLMVLSNLATLCGFSPRELTDWFWVAYVDAYDWVVEPNVLGMSTFADGGITGTKPYVSGAAYINRMSDYCGKCRLDPRKSTGPGSCPLTALYWSFLERHQDLLGSNQRLRMPYNTLNKKSASERTELRNRAERAIRQLEAGDLVD